MRIRHYSGEDLTGWTRLYNLCYPNYPCTAEVLDHFRRRQPAGQYRHYVVGELDGTLIGLARLHSCYWYGDDIFEFELMVDPEHRGRGLGIQLWELVVGQLQRLRWGKLLTNITADQPVALNWAERLGFTVCDTELPSRLELSGYTRPADYDTAVRRVEEQGLTLTTYGELDSPDKVRELWRLTEDVTADMPGSMEYQKRGFNDWYETTRSPARRIDDTLLVLDQGRMIGLTELAFLGGYEGPAVIECTGIHRDYRGRGLATALKYLSVDWAVENGVRAIDTINSEGNEAILGINRKLGFKPLPIWYGYHLVNEEPMKPGL